MRSKKEVGDDSLNCFMEYEGLKRLMRGDVSLNVKLVLGGDLVIGW